MVHNADMPDKQLTLPTLLSSTEVEELRKAASFDAVEDNGFYRLIFNDPASMERAGEALQVMREDPS